MGEEATEIVIAAKNPDPEEVKYEISDFLLPYDGINGRKRCYLGRDHRGTGKQIRYTKDVRKQIAFIWDSWSKDRLSFLHNERIRGKIILINMILEDDEMKIIENSVTERFLQLYFLRYPVKRRGRTGSKYNKAVRTWKTSDY